MGNLARCAYRISAASSYTCNIINTSKFWTFFFEDLVISEAIMAAQVSKKRKFVADGVFKAELNEFLTRELAEDGYSGVEVSLFTSNFCFHY